MRFRINEYFFWNTYMDVDVQLIEIFSLDNERHNLKYSQFLHYIGNITID